MKPVSFEGCNVVYAKDQPEYLPLPVRKTKDSEGMATSCWSASFRERLSILVHGRVYLHQMTFNQPLQPVMINVSGDPI